MVLRGEIHCFWLISMTFGCFGGIYGIISVKNGQNRWFFSLPDFFQMTYRVDIYCFWLIVWSKSAIDWLSARSASTLIKPQAIWVLNFIRANGRWRTLVFYNNWKKSILNRCIWKRIVFQIPLWFLTLKALFRQLYFCSFS